MTAPANPAVASGETAQGSLADPRDDALRVDVGGLRVQRVNGA